MMNAVTVCRVGDDDLFFPVESLDDAHDEVVVVVIMLTATTTMTTTTLMPMTMESENQAGGVEESDETWRSWKRTQEL